MILWHWQVPLFPTPHPRNGEWTCLSGLCWSNVVEQGTLTSEWRLWGLGRLC